MEHPLCFSAAQCQNLKYRQRSQTLQHFRSDALNQLPHSKEYLLAMYLNSQDPNGAYVNINQELPEEPLILPHHPHNPIPRSLHQYSHSRSHSQHHYHTAHQANDPSNYYNISNVEPNNIPISSKRVSHINEPLTIHNPLTPLDSIGVMQVCNELGFDLDSNPQIPPSRSYTISKSSGRTLYKNSFPQKRVMKDHYTDPSTKISIPTFSMIKVIGVSKKDRSMFLANYNGFYVDIPHHFTQQQSI